MIKEISEFDLAVMLGSDNCYLRIFSFCYFIILYRHFHSDVELI